ncbi:Rhamnulokinase [Rubripirellula obstinata]|uniref:Rhamnulokinase n=1 Tax=Rubripirellula obstinata TaxID=406547 RepID=A0A5B1CEZ4_9BACT|nr:rhamnulokinase family protein [Rubripirellula obstinata]KAA1258782.1 Rhamnulokinase [Rubripirellula obstinata]
MTVKADKTISKLQNYIGVDLGAESGRVMVAGFDGKQVSLTEKHRFATGGVRINDTLRWDVLHFWREIQTGLGKVAAGGFENLVSVGVDTWGVDYVLLGEDDEMLGLPWHYRDTRTRGTLDKVASEVPLQEVFSVTGNQFMEINTLFQLYAASRSGDWLNQAKCLLTIPDFFHWCLSGAKKTEFTNATTTQCLDPTTCDWSKPLLDRLKIPSHMLCDVIQPGDSLGSLQPSVCQETGLPPINVVAPATHDTGSAVVAVPVDPSWGNNWAYISSGTWSLVGVETDTPILSKEALAMNITNEGGVDGSWRLLKNVVGLWLVQRLKASFERAGSTRTYEEITQGAAQAPSLVSFIDPEDSSFMNPPDMMVAVAEFCRRTNQPVPETEASAVRCVLESLAMKYHNVLDSIAELSGRKIDVIHVVGGGGRNALLNQFIAFACGVPVIAGPVEATVLGNVLVQCRAAGQLGSLNEIREVVRNSSDLVQFDPEHCEAWAAAQEKFDAICSANTLSTPVA